MRTEIDTFIENLVSTQESLNTSEVQFDVFFGQQENLIVGINDLNIFVLEILGDEFSNLGQDVHGFLDKSSRPKCFCYGKAERIGTLLLHVQSEAELDTEALILRRGQGTLVTTDIE